MEHLRTVAIKGNVMSYMEILAPASPYRLLLLSFIFLMIPLLGWSPLNAQTLTCNAASANSPLQVAIDDQCTVFLVPDVILEAPQSAPGDKRMILRDNVNNVLADEINEITFDASAHVSSTLSLTITDVASNNFCVGYIMLVDNIAPSFSNCEAVSIHCSMDTTINSIGIPVVSDNCTNSLPLIYTDDVVLYPCDSLDAGVINRTWTTVDDSGNPANCIQQIVLERPELANIVFPADTVLSCDNPIASPDSTGRPMLDEMILKSGGFCNLRVGFTDDTTAVCGNTEFQIVRTWEVTEDCSNTRMTEAQIILILDSTPPEIICQDDIVIQADAGQCYATVTLPIPTITDNCDGRPDLIVNTSYGSTGLGPHPFVPVGSHTAQFVAIDECGNSNICTINITVVDNEVPTAVCGTATIGVSSAGLAYVNATAFDEGSLDNCATNLYYKALKMRPGSCDNINGDDSSVNGIQEWFDDQVIFCCEEIGDEIRVRLKVYEIDPGPGPIDPARENEGGDLYGHVAECMLSVEVQDKIGPAITCPPDAEIDCSEAIGDLSRFGSPIIQDNCGYTLDSTIVEDLNSCGIGQIRRTFTATDDRGNSNTCTQVIRIIESDPYVEEDIKWPEHFTSETCGVSLAPEDLPDGIAYPEVLAEKCGNLQFAYEDEQFISSFPACYKVLRYWTIIDWCTYDVNNPRDGGRFTHVQVLKVLDNIAPVIQCTTDTIRGSIDTDCAAANVEIPTVSATDCSDNITISHDSPYANSNGSDASGTYPLGETIVTFTATDPCGNSAECQVTVIVEDNTPPSPVCIVGLSVNLSGEGDNRMAMIDASAFNKSSMDNCTAEDNIRLTIRRAETTMGPKTAPQTEKLLFDCSDVGTQSIEFWATDEAGNSDYCQTFITIQDLDQGCAPIVSNAMIAGGVLTEMGSTVEDVTISINGTTQQAVTTNQEGHFELRGLPMGGRLHYCSGKGW